MAYVILVGQALNDQGLKVNTTYWVFSLSCQFLEVMLGAHILCAVVGYNLYISKMVVGERPDKMTFQ